MLPEVAALTSAPKARARSKAPKAQIVVDLKPEIPDSQYLSSFGVIGVSHKCADLELRSKLSFTHESARLFLLSLRESGLGECVVLSTCNRSEIYYIGENSALIESWLSLFCGISPHHLPEHIYRKSGKEAIHHLFTVAAGLDSAVLGETEILAQVKDAWNRSKSLKVCGSKLEMALQRALMASKRVRTETKISRHVTSVSSLSVRVANEKVGIRGKKITVVGAGKTGERVVKELQLLKPSNLKVANRTLEHAETLTREHGGKAYHLDDLDGLVDESEIVFLAIDTLEPVVTKEKLKGRMNPLLIVDLCVPRASEEEVTEIAGVSLVHMDVLEQACLENAQLRQAEVPKGEKIIQEELILFGELCIAREASQTIQDLQKLAERIKNDNLANMSERLEALSDEARSLVEEIATRVATGLLQQPIQKLRDPRLKLADRSLIAEAFGIREAPTNGK